MPTLLATRTNTLAALATAQQMSLLSPFMDAALDSYDTALSQQVAAPSGTPTTATSRTAGRRARQSSTSLG
jgi:hypothetical protein